MPPHYVHFHSVRISSQSMRGIVATWNSGKRSKDKTGKENANKENGESSKDISNLFFNFYCNSYLTQIYELQ